LDLKHMLLRGQWWAAIRLNANVWYSCSLAVPSSESVSALSFYSGAAAPPQGEHEVTGCLMIYCTRVNGSWITNALDVLARSMSTRLERSRGCTYSTEIACQTTR
jgi:hypothetical protein